ncbi:MAG: TolC family protein [Planctomycetaceae bacterium]|nr:TolC family protein [Planctomycetaceae bacterium]
MCRFPSLTQFALGVLIVSLCFQFGCRPQQPLYLGETGRWQQHYINKATNIEYPNVNISSLPEVCHTEVPLTLENPDPQAMWELTLEEAVQMALKNSKVIRSLSGVNFSPNGVAGAPTALLRSGGQARTVYDPALIESDPRFGQEAALAAFDAQLNAGIDWQRNNYYRGGEAGSWLRDNTGSFRVGISKYTAPGTQFFFNHTGSVEKTDGGLYSEYRTAFEGGFSHPLLQGSGVEFNRIAGPHGAPGNYGGVAIARINTDISITDFEMATRDLVADVERAYWSLYYAYHRLESVRSGRDAAYQTWRQTMVFAEIGGRQGSAQNLAQAEYNYFSFRGQAEVAQNNLFKAATVLRYAMGLSPSDGRLIRPIDDPITAPIGLDWHNVLCEALFRSPELRRQKWAIKQRELELTASKNFLKPRVDLDGGFRAMGWSAAGFMGRGSQGLPSAYSDLGEGDHTAWLGVTASMPLGFRAELAGFRNAQLNLAKDKALLHEQELELTHQLNDSFQEITLAYQQMQTMLATYRAASEAVRAVQTAYDVGTTTLDLLLQEQRRQAEAETGYYNSVIEYNLAIMMLHYRKGSLLEYNNICLAEGEWPAKAYFDAKRRAREREAGRYFNYGFTLPGIVSRGIYQQHQHGYNSTIYESLPNQQEQHWLESPIVPGESLQVIETEAISAIPMPMLPRLGEQSGTGTTPVSFTAPTLPSLEGAPLPSSSSAPARNMRYVR